MRYAEMSGNIVKFVLPAELSNDYQVLPPDAIEIELGADVRQGDIYNGSGFRRRTETELKNAARPGFNTQRMDIFESTKWARDRHRDNVELSIDDSAQWSAWLNYWKTLRNMPQQPGFDPRNPQWPTQPT